MIAICMAHKVSRSSFIGYDVITLIQLNGHRSPSLRAGKLPSWWRLGMLVILDDQTASGRRADERPSAIDHAVSQDRNISVGTGRERVTVSAVGEDLDRRLQAAFDDVVLDEHIAGSPCFHPPELRGNQHCSHPAVGDAVAADLAFAGLDENTP